jgi:hypothetical protein
MRVLYVEIAPWRELLEPGAAWDRAFTTPDYGRDPRLLDRGASRSGRPMTLCPGRAGPGRRWSVCGSSAVRPRRGAWSPWLAAGADA